MERNMALIGIAQLDTKQQFFFFFSFFDVTSAQGDLGWSSGQVVVVYKLCRCNFKCKTHKG
jgi:Trk-type K+ transport system membrane component